jgi:protein-disulfide isomerase
MNSQNGALRLLVPAVALLMLSGCCLLHPKTEPRRNAQAAPSTSAEFSDDRTMGDPSAPVVIIEYAAPTCPHCAHFATDGLPHLKQEYIDEGKVFYVFRTFPLMPLDGAVEQIARCLPRDQYFPFLDMLFRNQSEWDPDGFAIPDVRSAIVKMAGRAGIAPDKVDACIADRQGVERINRIAEEGVNKYGVRAVPTFVINGKVVEGYGGWTALKAEIDALPPKR